MIFVCVYVVYTHNGPILYRRDILGLGGIHVSIYSGLVLSVSKWRRILRGKTDTKSAPKTIFSGNGNGLKNFTFLSTREQKNVHTVYVKPDSVSVYGYRVWGTCNNRTMVPHKEIQWNNGTPQGKFYRLATKEKTIKYPISAMCRVCVFMVQTEDL